MTPESFLAHLERFNHVAVGLLQLHLEVRVLLEGVQENVSAGHSVEGAHCGLLHEDLRPGADSQVLACLFVALALVRNLLHEGGEGVLGHVLIDQFEHVFLVAEASVVQPASLDELVAELVLVLTALSRLGVVVADMTLNVFNCLLQVLDRYFILVFLEVDAPQIIHAAAMFLLIIQLVEDLCHLMVSNQCLVVVSFVE